MGYLKFDKNQLINLEYSLRRELLRTNRAGAFSTTTISSCNTRKYHGLLIVPQPQFGNAPHVLLSSLDETIIQHETEFNLGIHKYENNIYFPRGHKYVRNFQSDPIPKITYRVGGVFLEKEMLFSSKENLVMFKYTLVDAHSPTLLRFKPFMAFRNIHALSKANIDASNKYDPIHNGIKVTLYEGYSPLHIQFSKKPEYTHVPDWNYNIEYTYEKIRGYDYLEDLYVPGFFEIPIKKGESIVCVASTEAVAPSSMKRKFLAEAKKRTPRSNFENCLINAAEQFTTHHNNKTNIIAGYPWFGPIGRDTFISLPGLMLSRNDVGNFKDVVDTMISEMKGPFFPNAVLDDRIEYTAADSSLWFFWAMQKYAQHTAKPIEVWKDYGKVMKTILESYRDGTWYNIKMNDDGLLFAGESGMAVTWMNAMVDGKPVTPRIGFPVELNALWYNAIMFSLELARKAKDSSFISKWKNIPGAICKSFEQIFWDEKKGYLADYVNGNYKDWAVRPNQLFAASLPYSPIKEVQQMSVMRIIESELLTSRGLRTLAPKNIKYRGFYRGNQKERDEAYHNGSVFPWLFGQFAEAYLQLYGKEGLLVIKNLYRNFEPAMQTEGIGTISELYDGDPPHHPGGAISQAWAVAELLRVGKMISDLE